MRDLSKLGKGLSDLREYFSKKPDIVAVYIFGSFGTEYEYPFSDLDLGIVFTHEKISLRDELKTEAELSLLLKREKVDLVNLNKAPLKLRYRAVAEGELIYEGNFAAHSDFIEHVHKRYLDYRYDLEVYQLEYEKALKEAYADKGGLS